MSLLRSLTSLAVLALCTSPIIACSQSVEGDVEEGDESAIIGGTNSGTEDDAVMALYRRNQPHCAATLVGENVLVTALHCVTEIDRADPRQMMLGQVLQPTELSVRMGARPSTRPSATVSRIVVPDPVRLQSGKTAMASNDIAVIYVQPVDPAFSKVRPRRLAEQSPAVDATVTVVGFGVAEDPSAADGRRQKRDADVLAQASARTSLTSELDTGENISWVNRPREFTTETAACGNDSGGPAFDQNGNVVGIVSAVVGKCVEGSLSVFTDVASYRDFLRRAVGDAKSVGCLSDSQCGGASSGRVCDVKTNKCVNGCRAQGNTCPSGRTCSVQGRQAGLIGICRTTSGATDDTDPFYDNGPYAVPDVPGVTCPGNPLCPTTNVQQRECRTDAECGGANGTRPRVCDIPLGRCLDGCRVSTANMCALGQRCGAYADDPAIGTCEIAQPPAAPPGPPAQPPIVQPQQPVSPAAAEVNVADTGSTKAKKKKNKAKADDASCSVTHVGAPVSAAPLGLGLLGLLSLRRRRR